MGDSGDYSDCYCPHCGEGEEHFAECADPETAWKAQQDKIDALVEALESEKRICATWRKTAEANSEKLEKAQTINAAAEKLVRCKGRYHSEQNYRALAALFGVNTPDLPPLDDESHAVTVENLQESAYRAGLTAGWNLGLANNNDGFNKCLAAHAAGIKVEAE
ncbi:TPA: hypothetical protein ACPUIG_004805 [Klebsiella pneumoniae]|uniref:hypothetical protein n=1 Tax=Klebsiella sp. JB_Kp005 TaxID=3153358 RepID=UPI001D0F2C7A|nr:hypothetical protein [Klebsiella pneumoniae]MCL7664698.1 hypothetical protein [Klebsiella pneumoniae]MCQ0895164.1 hypothetical protein [Klebsiella pneumoniae]MDZ1606143.1 hypothetical protein [Klebsiella pneumoniae]